MIGLNDKVRNLDNSNNKNTFEKNIQLRIKDKNNILNNVTHLIL